MVTSATMSARDCLPITPSNDTDFKVEARAIFIGVGGDIRIRTQSGNTVTFKNLVSGYILPVQVVRVYQTGTTASELIALF